MSLRIGVLGATGVYGRHLVPRLVASGHRVRALEPREAWCQEPVATAEGRATLVKYKVALVHSDEGVSVSVPGLPGCWSDLRAAPKRKL
jgi:nucleoside-diphosphate-sugar epimerase